MILKYTQDPLNGNQAQSQMSGMHAGNDDKDESADLVIDDDKNTTTSKMF